MRHEKRLMAGTALALCMLVAPVAQVQTLAAESEEMTTENVKVTVRVGTLENGKKVPVKSYELVVADGTSGSKLLSGSRVAIPTSAGSEGEYVYQNIGFSSEIKAWIVDKKKIRVTAQIEDSRITHPVEGAPPVVETRQLQVNAVLTHGEPMELTRVQDVTDQNGFVEILAEIMP